MPSDQIKPSRKYNLIKLFLLFGAFQTVAIGIIGKLVDVAVTATAIGAVSTIGLAVAGAVATYLGGQSLIDHSRAPSGVESRTP